MSFTTVYILCALAVAGLLHIVWSVKYRGLPAEKWIPGAAWIRAFNYFALCNIVIAATGTLEVLLNEFKNGFNALGGIYTAEQAANTWWIVYCAVCFLYVFIAYWGLWSRMTLTFDRKFHLGPEIIFGLIWGWSTGGLLLSFYHLWHLTGVPGWANYILAYACMGFWQYAIQDYFWDVYVSPEHDTPRSIIIKTAVCHIPNVAICLGFLAIWDNYAIYVATQTFALVASTIFQKLPAPWATGKFHAPMTKPGVWGLPHGAGYTGTEA